MVSVPPTEGHQQFLPKFAAKWDRAPDASFLAAMRLALLVKNGVRIDGTIKVR